MPIIDEIKDRLDIVEVISGYLKLAKAGANYRALCPFHKEKTPSFMVSPERQIWHCFGCGEGGDIFKFVMKYENLDFPEALRLLAKQAGIELKREDPRIKNEMSKLYEICERAAEYFEEQLKKETGVINYLKKRGLKDKTIDFWQIGFAPDNRDGLFRYLVKSGFKADDILKGGLAIKSSLGQQSFFDRFRSRIIFPLFDSQDRIVGFTGRIFNETNYPKEPKYLNSPETPIFNKGRLLYGFSKTKKEIREKNQAILVEGQMDFLAVWQEGFQNVVATSGTALSGEQLKLLKRVTKNLVIAYDMDEAGRIATERAIDLAKNSEFSVSVLTLPAGVKDIADFVLAYPNQLEKIIKSAEESGEYYYRLARTGLDLNDLGIKKKAVNFLLSKVKHLANAVERSHWISKIANDFQIKESYLEEELMKIKSDLRPLVSKEETAAELKISKSRKELLGERILALTFKEESIRQRLGDLKDCFGAEHLNLMEIILANKFSDLKDDLLSEKIGYLNLLAEYEFSEEPDFLEEFEKAAKELRKETLKEMILQKSLLIKESEKTNDMEKLNKDLSEFGELLKKFANF